MTMTSRGKIVIVDDDPEICMSMKGVIEKSGYVAYTFDNGRDAISFLGGQDVDLVLTDLRMPGMDGMEVLDLTLAVNEEIPVIIMTAYTDIDLTVAALINGAFDYIFKPYDVVGMLKTIEKGITCRRQRQSEKPFTTPSPS